MLAPLLLRFRFLLVSHLGGYIYDSSSQTGTFCNGQGGQQPCWSCCSYGTLAMFAFDNGRSVCVWGVDFQVTMLIFGMCMLTERRNML